MLYSLVLEHSAVMLTKLRLAQSCGDVLVQLVYEGCLDDLGLLSRCSCSDWLYCYAVCHGVT